MNEWAKKNLSIEGVKTGVGNVGKAIDKVNPYLKSTRAAKRKRGEDDARHAELGEKTKGLNTEFDAADKKYKDDFTKWSDDYTTKATGFVGTYKQEIDKLKAQSEGQASDNTSTYTNDILPAWKQLMEQGSADSASAMSLEEYNDPNSEFRRAWEDQYKREGYEARDQGLRDFGVLSSLGAQAAQGQLGAAGSPLTAGAQGQIYASNQRQSGEAFSRAQKRMFDLISQGKQVSREEADKAYGAGERAQTRFGQTAAGMQGASSQYGQDQMRYRDELGGYAGDMLGVDSALNTDLYNMGMTGAGIDKGNVYAGKGREQDLHNMIYGGQQTSSNNQAAAQQANYANQAKLISSLAEMFMGSGMGAGGKKPKPDEGGGGGGGGGAMAAAATGGAAA